MHGSWAGTGGVFHRLAPPLSLLFLITSPRPPSPTHPIHLALALPTRIVAQPSSLSLSASVASHLTLLYLQFSHSPLPSGRPVALCYDSQLGLISAHPIPKHPPSISTICSVIVPRRHHLTHHGQLPVPIPAAAAATTAARRTPWPASISSWPKSVVSDLPPGIQSAAA